MEEYLNLICWGTFNRNTVFTEISTTGIYFSTQQLYTFNIPIDWDIITSLYFVVDKHNKLEQYQVLKDNTWSIVAYMSCQMLVKVIYTWITFLNCLLKVNVEVFLTVLGVYDRFSLSQWGWYNHWSISFTSCDSNETHGIHREKRLLF